MERKDRLSEGMTPEKVSKVYAILKDRFDRRRQKLRELEAASKEAADGGQSADR